ncbi:CHAT domain-containing protein [Moorena producens]|uniref:CHAT domain-containing protein n=1 Tax=Moorena producens TaxID=1155739 RepID=UPI003C78DBA7
MPPVLSQIPTLKPTLLAQDNAQSLVQQSQEKYKNGDFSGAIELLRQAVRFFEEGQSRNRAITLVNMGQMQSELGQHYQACETLTQALGLSSKVCEDEDLPENPLEWVSEHLRQIDLVDQINSLRTFGDVLRAIGRLEQSEQILKRSLKIVDSLSSSPEQAERQAQARSAVFLSLGNTFLAQGNLERDRQAPIQYEYEYLPWHVEQATEKSESYKNAEIQYKCVVTNCTTLQTVDEAYKQVDEAYKQVVMSKPPLSLTGIKAQLNLLSLFLETGQLQAAQELSNGINVSNLPVSRTKIYAEIKLAKSLTYLEAHKDKGTPLWGNITKQIETAIEEAEKLGDKRAESYASGNLGGLYEYLGKHQHQTAPSNWKQKAQRLTLDALYLAQPSVAPDIAYQWQWQLGRLLEGEGKRKEAIAYYEAAVKTLESVRGDLLTINSDVQFSFRDNVEPLYRQLVALLLPIEEEEPKQDKLKKSLYYVDSLQLAELQNFVRCNPQGDFAAVQLEQSDNQGNPIEVFHKRINGITKTYEKPIALIYPIILKNQVSVILKLPGENIPLLYKRLKKDNINGGYKDWNELIKRVHYNQRKPRFYSNKESDIKPLKILYKLLIKPFEEAIETNRVDTVVFILDGSLRNISMAALYDEDKQEFLVQKKYTVTLVPSVELLKRYREFESTSASVLVAGIKKERTNFYTPNWSQSQIDFFNDFLPQYFPIYKILFDDKKFAASLTKQTLKEAINSSSYTLVHLATHGEFSSNPKDTFIITDDETEEKNKYSININEFSEILQTRKPNNAIKLLFLSSCRTADGDKRAILGIAGTAIKFGANSTIAPLWYADQDYSNVLVKEFYKQMVNNKEISKAEALKLAQKSLLESGDDNKATPFNWAPFVLVGY